MTRLAEVARKHKNWALASLAVRVRLDAFVKVKEALDKMTAELQKQHKEEYEKREMCNKDIDETEDHITVATQAKKDLVEKKAQLENKIALLQADVVELNKKIKEDEVSLKQAGEHRKEENELYR